MKRILSIPMLALLVALSGCAADGTLANGKYVRAMMASQIVPPQPQRNTSTDGVSAVAAHANYQRSFLTPTPQGESRTFGGDTGK